MGSDQKDIKKKLDQLKQAYLAALPGKIEEIETAAAAVRGDPFPPEALEGLQSLYQQAHKLSGSGGTFGLSEISDLAGEVETACLAMQESPAPDQWQKIEGLLGKLRDVIDGAVTGASKDA